MSEKETTSIETNTVTKLINVNWSINKTCIDIANLSCKADKKGVIETCVKNGPYTFNLELCVQGWRRSQDGFSAFYLTVPRNHYIVNDKFDDCKDDINDFIARYTVTFGQNENKISRQSSIRDDFDLGVGFPNFTQISTLSNAIYRDVLEFNICIEIFERKSKIRTYQFTYYYDNNYECKHDAQQHINGSITAKLVKKMYFEKINCDAMIFVNYLNKKRIKKRKCIKVHKCILNAASPVFNTFFEDESKENVSSSIVMNKWNINTVLTMIKFIYLGKIELINNEMVDDQDDDQDEDQHEYQHEEKEKDKKDEINDLELECPNEQRALLALFQIAQYYEIKELLIACCHKLISSITSQSCCLFLIYLDRYCHLNEKMVKIKNYVLQFAANNLKTVQKTKSYLYLLQNKPYLLGEIITKIVQFQ